MNNTIEDSIYATPCEHDDTMTIILISADGLSMRTCPKCITIKRQGIPQQIPDFVQDDLYEGHPASLVPIESICDWNKYELNDDKLSEVDQFFTDDNLPVDQSTTPIITGSCDDVQFVYPCSKDERLNEILRRIRELLEKNKSVLDSLHVDRDSFHSW